MSKIGIGTTTPLSQKRNPDICSTTTISSPSTLEKKARFADFSTAGRYSGTMRCGGRSNQTAASLPTFDKDIVIYWSDKRMDRFVTAVIVGCGMVMLIAPLWILQALNGTYQKLGTITGFVVAFLGMLSCTTAAKPFETLAATAA
jgi:hypothetical protein